MARLRDNIVANYAGQIWSALMAVAFVPFYIRILGVESFGLVGFMLSLQALSQFFDFGIGGTVNRALAQRAHDAEAIRSTPDLVRTFELLMWPLSLLIGAVIWLAGPIISDVMAAPAAPYAIGDGCGGIAHWTDCGGPLAKQLLFELSFGA